MKRKRKFLAGFIAVCMLPGLAIAQENLVYMLRYGLTSSKNADFNKALATLQSNMAVIHIVTPQAYVVDQKGNVTGGVNPDLIDFAKHHP